VSGKKLVDTKLVFDESFFREEERLGFTISSMMKRAWAAQLEVLLEIDRLCKQLNINYYADFGTLLGAVRHNGYIPWDDDIDICMLREDYYVFLRESPDLLDKWYDISSVYNDPERDIVKARVINGRHINFDKSFLDKFHNCPYVVGVDIFPVDNVPDGDDLLQELKDSLSFLLKVEASIPEEGPYEEDVLQIVEDIENTFGLPIDYNNRLRHEVKKIYDILSAIYVEDDTEYVGCMMAIAAEMGLYRYKKQDFVPYKRVEFENITIPIMKCYKEVLLSCYGQDYMTPKNIGASHDYPFYKEQIIGLKDVMEKEYNKEFEYDFVEEFIEMKVEEVINTANDSL